MSDNQIGGLLFIAGVAFIAFGAAFIWGWAIGAMVVGGVLVIAGLGIGVT